MSLINCLLVDDEPPALKILEKYIASVDHLKLIGSCSNAFKAMEYLYHKNIDLMFLDIQMPKLRGTSLLKTLRHPPKVIFTTAFKEYAVDAFELDAVDYLLKPFSFERFIKAVNKLTLKPDLHDSEEIVQNSNPGFLYFRVERKMIKVYLNEIDYIESLKDYVKIHRVNAKPLITKQSISTLECMLPKSLFVRIHRSFIISLLKITAYTGHYVEVGKIKIPIGRVYSHQFLKTSLNYPKS